MSSVQPSIEGPPSSLHDPWDWTVDDVVSALTDHDSQLLKCNASLSLPSADSLANILRNNDVTGLALLTMVNNDCLRDELGIRSLGHRAAINHLIEQLQNMSLKYLQGQAQRSARLSSVGFGSRIGSPYFATPSTFEPRAASRALGSMISPIRSSAQPREQFALGQTPAQLRNDLKVGPELQGLDLPNRTTFRFLEDAQSVESWGIKKIEEEHDEDKPETTVNKPGATASGYDEPSSSIAKNTFTEQAEKHCHQGETTIIDETGKKRRRLVIAQPVTLGPTQTIPAKSPTLDEPPSSPETLRRDTNANPSFESNILPTSDCPSFDEELPPNIHERPVSVEAVTSMSDPVMGSIDSAAEPGIVSMRADGRKRVRPILVPEVDLDYEDQKPTKSIAKEVNNTFSLPAQDLGEVENAQQLQQRSYGKKAKRKADHIYLGFDSMPIDNLIYGDVALGKDLEKVQARGTLPQLEQPDEPDDFNVAPNKDVGVGQRLYVNARMKYFLRSQTVSLKPNGHHHVGLVPYPDRISRKNCPISITVFTHSSQGVRASRANRSKWIKDKAVPDTTEAGGRTGNCFNVADPALARDESQDPEWKALEKWNHMDGKDQILPLYGDSDSEGEYDLETWREMERERGKIARPLGRKKRVKLTSAEVHGTIDTATEEIVRDWTVKRLPKLKRKEWRLWARSRRDQDSEDQIESLTHKLEQLEARITGLRKEISQEEWFKTSDINKICKSIQPSIFDREDDKWKIATLKLQKAPERLPPAPRQPRLAKSLEPGEILEDGEEILTAGTETSYVSEDDLEDFIVEDDADGDTYQPLIVDDDLTMADVEDGIESDTFVVDEPKPKTPIKLTKEISHPGFSPSNVIDLTQQSDPVEPEFCAPKPEPSYAIRTPPLYGSENDSDIFQRSRSKKPVYRVPPTLPKSPTKTTEIISLESDSNDSVAHPKHDLLNHFPALNDVDGIKKMEAAELVERQDRKRLLIWTVAHAPAWSRRAASSYLDKVSMEVSRANVISGLTELLHNKPYLKKTDKEDPDSIMRIAAWCVCWTIPVKVTSEGLKKHHIIATLEDDDGYEPFYDFLLECLKHYQKKASFPIPKPPKKKRELIVREDSDEGLQDSQTRKRKYVVTESQETLDKRQAAQERMRGDEERRRREELKPRLSKMSSQAGDPLEIIVNPGKLDHEVFVRLNPAFGNGIPMKPHQKEGLQFMWREITGDHESLQGCLLAHAQGLGKTMQVISLLVTIAEASISENKDICQQIPLELRKNRTLILCPVTLVENWWDELLIWPPTVSNPLGKLRKVSSAIGLSLRLREIQAWSKEGGVLILGYPTFTEMIQNKPRANRPPALDGPHHERIKEALLEGPSLVVADEAHNFKNRASDINQAINQIKTTSRIALTGTPLANRLGEYYSMIDWIAPDYLGKPAEFLATYEEPIYAGLYRDSTDSQYRESRKRLKALELELEPKVHRRGNAILHAELKGKAEFVITVPLTKLQRDLYCIYAGSMLGASKGDEPRQAVLWSWLGLLQLLCNHPQSFREGLLALKAEHEGSSKTKPSVARKKARQFDTEEGLFGSEEDAVQLAEPVSMIGLSQIISESQKVFEVLTTPIDALCLSNKMQVLMSILEFAEAAQDKVLVFSHRISTLDYIGEQLGKINKEYARIDGKMLPEKRQPITKEFNEGKTNICLISTRAGGTGLNLFGANRVVIIDDHFNPAWEQQAIGRAYRIGQQKPVYVYRLTVGGTFEQAIQNQALFKEQLATRVVDKKNPNRHAIKGAGQYLFLPKTVEQQDLSQFLKKDALLDHLLDDQTTNHILSVTPSETFHIEDGIELTPEESKEAEQMKKDFELSRRDPMAHNALINQRKEEEIRKLRQHVASFTQRSGTSSNPPYSTQPSRWDTPFIATVDMLLPPSTAPAGGPLLYPPSVDNASAAGSSNIDQPQARSLPGLGSKAGNGASVLAPKQTRPSLVAPRHLSGTPEFTSHDLQKHIEESVTFLSNDHAPLEKALKEAIDKLFGDKLLGGSPPTKGLVPKALQKSTREDFQGIISRKCLENKYELIADPLRLLYARELRQFITRKAKTEEEHRRLASGLRYLLDKESVNPKTLLKILGDKLRPISGQPEQTDGQTTKANPKAGQQSDHYQSRSGPINGVNGHKTDIIGGINGSKEDLESRKRSIPADEEHTRKKAKRAPAETATSASSGAMRKTFEDLLRREAARCPQGGSST